VRRAVDELGIDALDLATTELVQRLGQEVGRRVRPDQPGVDLAAALEVREADVRVVAGRGTQLVGEQGAVARECGPGLARHDGEDRLGEGAVLRRAGRLA
jgi:hypothetical protein